jgi:hypothetical protein
MLSRMLPLLLVLLSANVLARGFPVEVFEYIDNARVVVFVNEADIDKTLHWIPFEGALPLTLTDALNAIQQHVAANPELTNAVLSGVELKPVPHHEGYWNYLVRMKTFTDGKPVSHYFIVLMDGKIVSGIKEPETVK